MRFTLTIILAAMAAACGSGASDRTSNGDVVRVGGTTEAVRLTDVDVRDYELDMAKVRKWVAGMDALMAAAQQDSGVAAAIASSGNETTRQTIARLEANTKARDILDRAGLSAKDYVMTMTAYLHAAMADAAQRSNPQGKAPDDVNPKNVEFIRQHRPELEPLLKKAGVPT